MKLRVILKMRRKHTERLRGRAGKGVQGRKAKWTI
jgi:hypothetical protein